MKGRGWIILLGLTVAGVLGAGGWWLYERMEARTRPGGIVAASGRIEVETVQVAPSVGGRVLRLAVAESHRVEAGDLVAEIDARVAGATLRETEAAVEAAEANRAATVGRLEALRSELALARTEARRYGELYARDAIARQVVDRAEAAREMADRQARVARARREAAEVKFSETRLLAPVPGTIDRELTREGEMASPGRPVVTLLRAGSAKLRVYLPLREAERIRPGTEARVYLEAFRDRVFEGWVEWVADRAEFTPRDVHMPDERATLVFAADIRLPDPLGVLKDGFPADAYLRAESSAPWPDARPW